MIITAESGFTLAPLSSGIGVVTAEQLGSFSDEEDGEKALTEAWGKIADGIIKGWKSYFLPASAGTHSTYSGSATLINVG